MWVTHVFAGSSKGCLWQKSHTVLSTPFSEALSIPPQHPTGVSARLAAAPGELSVGIVRRVVPIKVRGAKLCYSCGMSPDHT